MQNADLQTADSGDNSKQMWFDVCDSRAAAQPAENTPIVLLHNSANRQRGANAREVGQGCEIRASEAIKKKGSAAFLL